MSLSSRVLSTAFAATTVAAVSTVAVVVQPQAAEAACITTTARCFTYDYQGVTYDITATALGTYSAFSDLAGSTNFWWGSESLAVQVLQASYAAFGGDGVGNVANDVVAYSSSPLTVASLEGTGQIFTGILLDPTSATRNWLTATAQPNTPGVPTPTLLPALVGLGVAAYRKRKAALSAKS